MLSKLSWKGLRLHPRDCLPIVLLLQASCWKHPTNLWFPIAIHFAWNFMQSGIFGVSTSGSNMGKSLLATKIEGAEWFTGGQFGPEGSIQATIFCLVATIVLLLINYKQHNIIKLYRQTKELIHKESYHFLTR